MTNKICSRCKKEKPISEYHRHPSTRDGRDSQCKECHNLACKKYDQSNKGKFAHQKYCQSEKGKLTKKQYNQSEEGKLTRKQYDQSNKGKLLQKKYYQSEAGKAVKKKASKKWRSEEENRFRWDVERQARHWLKKLGIDIRSITKNPLCMEYLVVLGVTRIGI